MMVSLVFLFIFRFVLFFFVLCSIFDNLRKYKMVYFNLSLLFVYFLFLFCVFRSVFDNPRKLYHVWLDNLSFFFIILYLINHRSITFITH